MKTKPLSMRSAMSPARSAAAAISRSGIECAGVVHDLASAGSVNRSANEGKSSTDTCELESGGSWVLRSPSSGQAAVAHAAMLEEGGDTWEGAATPI